MCNAPLSLWFSVALRPQRRDGLLGTGTEWEGGERVKGSTPETARNVIVQELCESRGGRPGLSVLTSFLVSVDVKIY